MKTGGYKPKHVCPFISIGVYNCHHTYAKNNKDKPVCAYYDNQTKCPLFKLWKKQLNTIKIINSK